MLILRDGFRGVRRFGDFCDDLGIARNILTDRLDKLVATDPARSLPGRRRHEYRLTARADLSPRFA